MRSEGYGGWLKGRMQTPPSSTVWDWLESRGYGVANTEGHYDNSSLADFGLWRQLFTAPDSVRQRCTLALSEFFVVSLNSLEIEWRSHVVAHYWDLLSTHAFGNFRTLLEAVTLNPAMGQFLNTRGNQKENAQGRQPDENYAREVMQLFTIGLARLNIDGTPQRDGNGRPLDSYTPADVTNLARVFTGWDFDKSVNPITNVDGRNVGSTAYARKPMAYIASRHSTLAATFLGITIPANTAGPAALKTALDTLFNHPNVGPFFGRQMIQRLVTGNPSPAYVARVARAFNDDGTGVRGNLAAVFSAVLLDAEARGATGLGQNTFGKLREPLVRFVQWGRTFGLNSPTGEWKIYEKTSPDNRLGQSPLRAGSVFNFFRPGYVPPSTALAASQTTAPEFQLVTEVSVGGYLNYLQGVIQSGIDGTASASYATELGLATNAAALVARLNLLLCANQLSAATVTLIVNALNATPLTNASSTTDRLRRIHAAVLLVMASAEYLVQK